jgi:Glycosyltransferases, probably involved in cell wall biogenesis
VLNRRSKAQWATLCLVGISVFSTSRYIWWRVTETLGFGDSHYHWYDFVPTFILLAAECYAWITLFLGYIQTAWPLQRKPVPLISDFKCWPDVDIYIPTYNEPLSVVRSTVIASLTIDWPEDKLHVYLLDDGTRDEFRAFAAQLGAGYITRTEHSHAKAGNLNHAMTQTNGEYIAIF